MWTRFLCWFLGHKIMLKASTGQKMSVVHPMGHTYDFTFYKWERQRFCIRCGHDTGFKKEAA